MEGLKHLRVLGMHWDKYFRLHGLDHVSYLIVIEVS